MTHCLIKLPLHLAPFYSNITKSVHVLASSLVQVIYNFVYIHKMQTNGVCRFLLMLSRPPWHSLTQRTGCRVFANSSRRKQRLQLIWKYVTS